MKDTLIRVYDLFNLFQTIKNKILFPGCILFNK